MIGGLVHRGVDIGDPGSCGSSVGGPNCLPIARVQIFGNFIFFLYFYIFVTHGYFKRLLLLL